MLKALIISMRPQQWYKNVIIFIGLVFSYNLLNTKMYVPVIAAFIIFCLLSGSVYILNDIKDIEKDRIHPKKKLRPIASGELSIKVALPFSIIAIPVLVYFSFSLNFWFGAIATLYLIQNILYTFALKDIPIVDILVVAFGFVLRAVAGAVVISVDVSPWLIICTFLLAILLAAGKRRHEVMVLDDAAKHRKSASNYSVEFLEQILNVTTSSLLVSYLLYTFFTGNYSMMLTIPFAFYGVFRYLQLVHVKNFGDNPELVLKDLPSIVNMILWSLTAIIALYVVKL